jgi:hypothetical protein
MQYSRANVIKLEIKQVYEATNNIFSACTTFQKCMHIKLISQRLRAAFTPGTKYNNKNGNIHTDLN